MITLNMQQEIICVRGAGDLATGVIQKLARSGFRVYALEIPEPTAIRRQVALSTAMNIGEVQIEDIIGRRVECSPEELDRCWQQGVVPIIADPAGDSIPQMHPDAVVDAILAKKNLGTHRRMAPFTIALGPGFSAPEDVNIVIETMRGHTLGSMIQQGQACPNTGQPGEIAGQSELRVLRAPCPGTVKHLAKIGDYLDRDQPVFQVGEGVVVAPFAGVIRGLIAEGMWIPAGMKTADIDPRRLPAQEVFQISDKARCLGGAVLEAYLYLRSNYLA